MRSIENIHVCIYCKYIHMNVHSRKGVIFLHGNIIQKLWTSSPTGQPCIHCFVHTYVCYVRM